MKAVMVKRIARFLGKRENALDFSRGIVMRDSYHGG